MAKLSANNSATLLRSDVPHASSNTRHALHLSSTGGKGPVRSSALTTNTNNPSISATKSGRLGLGLGTHPYRRHRRILRDTIQSITRGDMRRLARRGGVRRLSGDIYNETRKQLRARLETLLKDLVAVVESSGRKTVCVSDVVFVLKRGGTAVWGFGEAER